MSNLYDKPAEAKRRLFISYSRADLEWAKELYDQLLYLKNNHDVDIWMDVNSIRAGEDWETAMQSSLESSELVLLLISDDFFASDWCYKETEAALERRRHGTAVVVPIVLRGVNWWRFTTLYRLNALPKNARPITDPTRNGPPPWGEIKTGIEKEIINIKERGIPKPSEMDKALRPYASITPEIRRRLTHANCFWLLSRTSLGWWKDFDDVLNRLSKRTRFDNRVLVLAPDSKAFAMTDKDYRSWEEEHGKPFCDYQQESSDHIDKLRQDNLVDLRLLDRVVPHVILFVDPPSGGMPEIDDRAVAFYLLPSWDTNDYRYQDKYVLEVPAHEIHHFRTLYRLFENLWNSATPLISTP